MIGLIKTKFCPTCAAPIVSQGVDVSYYDGTVLVHSNGQRWEWVKFSCGKQSKWIPNFGSEEQSGQCRNDPAYKLSREIKSKLISELCDTIRSREGLNSFDRDELIDAIGWRARH